MSFNAVLFDLDGTLLDTLADIAAAMNSVLVHEGRPTHTVEAYRQFVGSGTTELVRRAVGEHLRDEPLSRLVRLMRDAYAANPVDRTRSYAGVEELLGGLADRGVRFAVLSNKDHEMVQRIVRKVLPGHSFSEVVGLKPGVPAKPDPTSALGVSGAMEIAPEDVLYVGDSDVDMVTALRAGMYPVGAAWGFRGADELKDAGAAVVIEHPMDLLDIVSNGRGGM